MPDQLKNVLIGIFVLAAVAIVTFVLLFLHPDIGDEGKLLRVRFSNVDKVSPGTRVTYAGKPVGEVIEIREVEYGRAGPADTSGRMYLYELKLRVDSTVNVFNTDEISLRTSGLLGERNVEITPIAPKPGQPLKLVDREVLFATEATSVEESLKEIKKVADKIETTFDSVNDMLVKIHDTELISKFSKIANNLEDITTALNQPKSWSETLENLHSLSAKANKSWDKLEDAFINIRDLTKTTKKLVENVSKGEGSIGKILVKDDLYLRLTSLLGKGETMFDDINHYGLLFHTDKGWQRLRARRLNLLQRLCSPQEFRNYFNDEIDQISTSLSRVAMVLDKEQESPCCGDLMLNQEFTKVFSELLRRVSMIEEELRMYNTQVVETQVMKTELVDRQNCCSAK